MLQIFRKLPRRLVELPAITSQIFPFLLARNYRLLPSNAPNPPILPSRLLEVPRNLPNRVLDVSWQASEIYEMVLGVTSSQLWQTKSSLFIGPKFPFKYFKSFETFQTGSLGLPAIANQIIPFLMA